MMNSKCGLYLILLFIFLSSCHSISSNRSECGIPERTVIFSFDDGPEAMGDTTARLLDVLKKYQIQSQFCLLGENVERYPDLVRRIYDEGHIIINHGYFDRHAKKMKKEEFRDNLIRGEKAISAALGFEWGPKLYRPHGGHYGSKHEKIWIEEGYEMIPVSVRLYDAVKNESSKRIIIRRSIKRLEKQDGGIILFHDGRGSWSNREKKLKKHPHGAFDRSWIPDTMEEIINILSGKDFIFRRI